MFFDFFKSLPSRPLAFRRQLMWLGVTVSLFLVFLVFLADLKHDLSQAWLEKPSSSMTSQESSPQEALPSLWGALRASLSDFWQKPQEAEQKPQLQKEPEDFSTFPKLPNNIE